MPLFGKVGVEITGIAANSTAMVTAVLMCRGVKEKSVMPQPSTPAHPVGAKSRMAAWLWDKEKAELCKERSRSGSPIRLPPWAGGLGAQ